MAHIIGKQPNGLYCVYTTISDGIYMWDCTEEDLVQQRLKDAEEQIRKDIALAIATPKSEKKYKEIMKMPSIEEVAHYWHDEFSKEVN